MAGRRLPYEEIPMRTELWHVMDYIRKMTLTAPKHFHDGSYRRVDQHLCHVGADLSTMLRQFQGQPEYHGWIKGYSRDIDTFGKLRAEKAKEFLDRVQADLLRVGEKIAFDNAPNDVLFGFKPSATEQEQPQQDDEFSWFRSGLGRHTLFDARDRGIHFQRTPATHSATSQTASNDPDQRRSDLERQDDESFRAHAFSIDIDNRSPDDEMFVHPTPTELQDPMPQIAQPLEIESMRDETDEYIGLVNNIAKTLSAFMSLLKTVETDKDVLSLP